MYIITEDVRQYLKKPFGKVYKQLPPINGRIISIGDITTLTLLDNNIIPNLSIVDFKTKRNIPVSINHKFNKVYNIVNPPGCISDDSENLIKYLSKEKNLKNIGIVVSGEEDLLALPVVKYFPTGTNVLYGQPDEGIVHIVITDSLKKEIDNILKMMIKK